MVMRSQRHVAILSFTPWTLHHQIAPIETSEMTELGQRLMGRRLELGRQKKFAAARRAANERTYLNWESGRTTPEIRYLPRIIDFLGFDPHPVPIDLPDRLRAIRCNLGLSVKRLSSILKADESVVTRWERGSGGPTISPWRVIRNLYRQGRFRSNNGHRFLAGVCPLVTQSRQARQLPSKQSLLRQRSQPQPLASIGWLETTPIQLVLWT